jgi:hypothetical protein
VPFSCFKWIYTVIRNRKLIELDHIHLAKSCIKELDNVASFINVFFKSGPQKVILEMVKRQFTLSDLDALPCGVSLFLQESLYTCKIEPPGDWSVDAYILIEREELAELFIGYQIRGLNQRVGPEEVFIFVFNSSWQISVHYTKVVKMFLKPKLKISMNFV